METQRETSLSRYRCYILESKFQRNNSSPRSLYPGETREAMICNMVLVEMIDCYRQPTKIHMPQNPADYPIVDIEG